MNSITFHASDNLPLHCLDYGGQGRPPLLFLHGGSAHAHWWDFVAPAFTGEKVIGAILFGIDTYIPLYIQGVQGGDARLAGRSLMPLFLTWAFSVAVAARAVVHRGLRFGGMVGAFFITMGSLGLVAGAIFPQWYRYGFYPGLVLVGLGMGPA